MAIPRRDFCISGKIGVDDACCITALSENAASLSISPSPDCWVCYANNREEIVEVLCIPHVMDKVEEIGRNDDGLSMRIQND